MLAAVFLLAGVTQACATQFLGIDWEAVTRLPKWSLLILIGLTTLIQEDLACIGAGLLVVAGILTMPEALVTCFLGLWIGDILLYLAGRHIGRPIVRRAPILDGIEDGEHFYFVHSYYVVPKSDEHAAVLTDYHQPFCSMVWRDNVFATQFHPEKSQSAGLRILRNFAELTPLA